LPLGGADKNLNVGPQPFNYTKSPLLFHLIAFPLTLTYQFLQRYVMSKPKPKVHYTYLQGWPNK